MPTICFKNLKKLAQALTLTLIATSLSHNTYAQDIYLPEIGTAGMLGLSVQKEEQLGNFFMRQARSAFPIIEDPVMDEYISSLGNKLVLHADHVMFPFEFFLVNDPNLNAAAFLGGKVQINTGLFIYSQTEDEFSSVLAHEISHVTQRHLARFIEDQSLKTHMTIASVIGSIAMAIINPVVGMAAMNTTMGASAQSRINFTRDNEYEADRIGIALLYRAGFNPQGTIDMFRRLLSMQGNLNPAFTMLIDHPLSDIRVAEAQNRAAQLPPRKNSTNPDFYLAKARVDVRYTKQKPQDLLPVIEHHPLVNNKTYQNYAKALLHYELGNLDKARECLNQLGPSLQNNVFVIDLLTDLDLKANRSSEAIARLKKAYRRTPNSLSIVVNLANAYLQSNDPKNASKILRDYNTRLKPTTLTLELLATAQEKNGDKCSSLQSLGNLLALKAQYAASIGAFNEALRTCRDHLTQEKIKARVVEITNQRAQDEAITQG